MPRHPSPADQASRWQRALNESWPYRNKGGYHARGIPDQVHPITVEVRIVWARDGEEWVTGRADRWIETHVHVSVNDDRLQVPGVWVRPGDVRRI